MAGDSGTNGLLEEGRDTDAKGAPQGTAGRAFTCKRYDHYKRAILSGYFRLQYRDG